MILEFIGGYAKTQHTYKDKVFNIVLQEPGADEKWYRVFVSFPTEKGKWQIQCQAAKELVQKEPDVFKEMMCKQAFESYYLNPQP
jgi:hypothetical protein